MISEAVLCMSILLGILNYILFAIVAGHTIHRYSDPIVPHNESDAEESQSSEFPRAA